MLDLLTDKRQTNAPEIVYVPPTKYLDPTPHRMKVLEERRGKTSKHQSLKEKIYYSRPIEIVIVNITASQPYQTTKYFIFSSSRPHLSSPFSKYSPSYYYTWTSSNYWKTSTRFWGGFLVMCEKL